MKRLAEFNGIQGMSVYARLSPVLNEIAESEKIADMLRTVVSLSADERNSAQTGRKFLENMIGVLLGEKPEATLKVLAILSECEYDEMAQLTAPELWALTTALLEDNDFIRFFFSFVNIQAIK